MADSYGSQQFRAPRYRTGTVTFYQNNVPLGMQHHTPITPDVIHMHHYSGHQPNRVFIQFMDDRLPISLPDNVVQSVWHSESYTGHQQPVQNQFHMFQATVDQRFEAQGMLRWPQLLQGPLVLPNSGPVQDQSPKQPASSVQQAQAWPGRQQSEPRGERVLIDLTDESGQSHPLQEPKLAEAQPSSGKKPRLGIAPPGKPASERILTERVTFLWQKIHDATEKRYPAGCVVVEWKRWLDSFEAYPIVKHKQEWTTLYWSSNEAAYKHLRFVSKYFFDYGSTRLRFVSWFALDNYGDEFRKEMLRLAEGRDDGEFGYVQMQENEELEKEVKQLEWEKAKRVNLAITTNLEKLEREDEERLEKRREYKAQKKAGTWRPKKIRETRDKREKMSEKKRKREEEQETRVEGNKRPRKYQKRTMKRLNSLLGAYPSPPNTPAEAPHVSEVEDDLREARPSPANIDDLLETPSFIDPSRPFDDLTGFLDGSLPYTSEQLENDDLTELADEASDDIDNRGGWW